MTDEVTIIDRIEVDIDGLSKFDDHAALPPAEPLEAVFVNAKIHTRRTLTVHGFTAAGHPLVLDPVGHKLVRVWSAATQAERFERIQRRATSTDSPVGPFTPAPPGMVAVFDDGTRDPVVFYDAHGRPVLIDREKKSRELYLITEDESLIAIEGNPAI